MKKRVLAVTLAVALCFSLFGCGSKETDAEITESAEQIVEETKEETEEVVEETTQEPEEEKEEDKEEDKEDNEEAAEEPVEEAETEEVVSLMGYNMIENPDFENGMDGWFLYTNGGLASLEAVDGQLVTSIDIVGKEEHGVQIYYDGFAIEQNCVYEIQFDACSDVEREVQYRIQINGGDYHFYSGEYITLTPEMQHYDITFTMEEATDPAPRLCFNMGYINDKDPGKHEVIFDNFDLQCIDESNRVIVGTKKDSPMILVNQLGYRPEDAKIAVLSGKEVDDTFAVVNVASGETVYEGKAGTVSENANTGRTEAMADFTDFTTPGTYKIVADNCGESYEFVIVDYVYDYALQSALKMFYLQRCGTALDSEYAGDFAHKECHTEMATIYGTDKQIDVSGGWHDAGDYGRYVVSGAKAVADLLLAYENYPDVFGDDLGIPESGNEVPDILDEARYELEWMLKMQDAKGGVYHKVTCAVFPGTVMPEEETDELIVSPVSLTATGDFAAVMAMAYRTYKNIDKDFANTCKEASEKALDYLNNKKSSKKGFQNPDEIVTGEYPDTNDKDERFWANAEAYKSFGDKDYYKKAKKYIDEELFGLGWADVGDYGAYALASCSYEVEDDILEAAKEVLKKEANTCKENAQYDTFQSTVSGNYCWGSNMVIADNGMLLYITGNDKLAKAQLDYLLGNNGNNYCFFTGFGDASPTGTHHRPSQVVGSTMPGMLVGGPNSNLEDPYAQAVLKDTAPALCYVDNEQSFSCNEVTVYWNSPFVYLLAATISEK